MQSLTKIKPYAFEVNLKHNFNDTIIGIFAGYCVQLIDIWREEDKLKQLDISPDFRISYNIDLRNDDQLYLSSIDPKSNKKLEKTIAVEYKGIICYYTLDEKMTQGKNYQSK